MCETKVFCDLRAGRAQQAAAASGRCAAAGGNSPTSAGCRASRCAAGRNASTSRRLVAPRLPLSHIAARAPPLGPSRAARRCPIFSGFGECFTLFTVAFTQTNTKMIRVFSRRDGTTLSKKRREPPNPLHSSRCPLAAPGPVGARRATSFRRTDRRRGRGPVYL